MSLWGPKWPAPKSHFSGHVFALPPVACSAVRQLWRCCVGRYRHRTPWALHLQNDVNRDWKGSWLWASFRTDPTKDQLSEIGRQGENGEASSKNTENDNKKLLRLLSGLFHTLGHRLVFRGWELTFHRDPKEPWQSAPPPPRSARRRDSGVTVLLLLCFKQLKFFLFFYNWYHFMFSKKCPIFRTLPSLALPRNN